MIIVECYKDKALVYRMGFTTDPVGHEKGRSRVLGKLEEEQKAVGIIDEDPFAGRPEYLREYDERDTMGDIKLLIKEGDDGKRVIQISPRLEDWLYTLAKRNRLSPEKFNLPDAPDELHGFPLKRDKNFRRFLIELNRANDDEISIFKQWINEAIN
jgi:hypothetical protein